MEHKTTVKVLDACEQWADLEQIKAACASATSEKCEATTLKDLAELVKAEQLVEHDGRWLRDRRTMVRTRMDACGIASKEGTPLATFEEALVTPRDLAALVSEGHLVARDVDGGKAYSVSLESETHLWTIGMRLALAAKLPSANPAPTLTPIEQEVLDALGADGDWITTSGLQGALNGARAAAGVEHLAEGPVTAALTVLFNAELAEMRDPGNGERLWREGRDRVTARRAQLLTILSLTIGDGLRVEELVAHLGVPELVVRCDADELADAGIVTVGDRVHLRVALDQTPDAWRFVAGEVSHAKDAPGATVDPGAGKALIAEAADWRKKYEAERKVRLELESWIGRKGFSAQDALDEVRGVTVVARPKREEFDWTSSRIVDSAEKGVIFGEVLALENEVAAERARLDEAKSEGATRIKTIEVRIRDLKNAAACNTRVVSRRAYKVTNWSEGKVRTYAVDTDEKLAEEDIPKGQQRTIETEPKAEEPVVSLSIDGGKTEDAIAPAEQLAITKEGAASVVDAATERKPLPQHEGELTEAVFEIFEAGNRYGIGDIQSDIEERFEVPAAGMKRLELALDRLVERGALEIDDEGCWMLAEVEAPPPAPKVAPKRKGGRKSKAAEASAT